MALKYLFNSMPSVRLLPALPWCRAVSTERECRPVADGAAVCADKRSQHLGCTPPQCVQTNYRSIKMKSFYKTIMKVYDGTSPKQFNINMYPNRKLPLCLHNPNASYTVDICVEMSSTAVG